MTSFTIRLPGVCNKSFRRIFITWYFKEVVNRCLDKFSRKVEVFGKMTYYFSVNILPEAVKNLEKYL